MNSPLSVEAYRHLLRVSDRDEEHSATDAAPLVPLVIGDRFDALKAAVRRKRRRPTGPMLTPLDRVDSPQHTHRMVEIDMRDGDGVHQSSPTRRPLSPARSALPPLTVNVLERKRLFLTAQGEPVVGVEEILQLQELASPPRLRASPLQLIAVPRKVFEDDEVALMPCHSLHYRYVPSLAVEMWKEPLRDRDKNWRDDELAMILATLGGNRAAETKMTRSGGGPGGYNTRKGTWRKLDSQRLQIKSSQSTRTALGVVPEAASPKNVITSTSSAVTPRDVSQPSEVLLRVQGAMISRTYCIVTIYGVGIYGRLYSEGLADRAGAHNRFLRIDAYAPSTSATSSLRVSLADLEWVFEAHPDLLAPGRKQTVLTKVVSLLYFQYPEDEMTDLDESLDPTKLPPPVLCISPDEKMNEAERRRREREERLRREEEERLRLLAMLMRMPRRARHRVVCALRRVSGHAVVVSIYHFPTQVRNFLVSAYHTRSSRTLTLAVGVQEAAFLSGVATQPHKWSPELKTQIATALLPRLFLRAAKTKCLGETETATTGDALYRVALAIKEDRMGALGAWLPLPAVAHAGSRKHEAVAKYTKDGQQELRLALTQQLAELERAAAATGERLRGEIAEAEAAILALQKRDAELRELIEDINSGKGMAPVGVLSALAVDEATTKQDKQRQHEQRRGHKAARKTIKDETKALQARIAAWKRELDMAKEHCALETEKAQTKFDRALYLLTQRAVTTTLALWFDPTEDRKKPLTMTQRGGNTQRRRLLRGEIRAQSVSLASGACRLRGRPLRFSVFAELPPHTPRKMRPRQVRPFVESEEQEDNDDDEEGNQSEQDEDQDDEEEQGDNAAKEPEWFVLSLYDAATSRTWSLRLTRLEWLAYTKSQHDAQLAIAALRVPTSEAAQQVAALDESYESARTALHALKPLKKNDKKRRQLLDELIKNRLARHALWKENAPWHQVVRALCERLREDESQDGLVLDRCIYRATLELVSVVEGDGEGTDGVVECEVWATQLVDVVSFHARDKATDESWTLAYPDSVELVKEFAVETQLELQLHVEAIAMTLLLYTESGGPEDDAATTRVRKMRFEE